MATDLMLRASVDVDSDYASYWLETLIPRLPDEVIDLHDELDLTENFAHMVETFRPGKLYISGHGNAYRILGYGMQPVLDRSDAFLTADMDVFMVSCSTFPLGQTLRAAGARSVIGFTKELVWPSTKTSPEGDLGDDATHQWIHEIGIALAYHGPQEAFKVLYEKGMEIALRLSESPDELDQDKATWLIWNVDHAYLLSDLGDYIPPPDTDLAFFSVYAPVILPMALLGVLAGLAWYGMKAE